MNDMRYVMKEIICDKIDELKSICLNDKYSDSTCNDISALLSEAIDRINWITLVERMDGVYLTTKQYEQLLEYKHMYEDLYE